MTPISRDDIAGACEQLKAGAVVAVPTDTVYGLAVDPSLPGATERLFVVKTRPDVVALPVLVADIEAAMQLSAPSAHRQLTQLSERLWPGALTVIVPRGGSCSFNLGGDPSTIGLRISGAHVMRELCASVGPLAVSSANLHGRRPCTTPEELRACFGEQLYLLDGGRCDGEVSTVIDLTGPAPTLRRAGAMSLQTVLNALS